MPQVKSTPAAETALDLDGEETLSERGSVGSRSGPNTLDGGAKEASSGNLSAGSKRKHDSLSCDRVELDGPEVARSSSSDSTWSIGSLDDNPTLPSWRKKNGHSERSVSSSALISRPRGVLRLRKLGQNVSMDGGTGGGYNVLQSNDISKATHIIRRKKKRKPHALKENRVGGDDPVSCLKTQNGTCDQDSRTKSCSQNDTLVEKQSRLSGEPSKPVHVDKESSGHEHEEDNATLEEYAARMLCYLSDNRCVEPPRIRMRSPDRSSDESSLQHSNHFKNPSNKVKDVASPARSLRKRDGKEPPKKRRPRRHFYEVSPHDVDPFSIVKERIRVFWPLDEIWYFGLVKEYDPLKRLHHVKYEDKDEEWINLQKERIKLLLLPGDTRKRSNRNNSKSVFKLNREGDKREEDKNITESLGSEPIISLLARSNDTRPATSSDINKMGHSHSNSIPVLLDQTQCLLSNSPNVKHGNLCSNDAIPGSSLANDDVEALTDRNTPGIGRFHFVYSRKRFCKRTNGFLNILEQDSNPKSRSSSAVIGWVTDMETGASVKHIILVLSLPLKSVYKFISEDCSVWASNAFHPQHGTLVALWPAVCLDILVVDNALGLKYLLLETCLRSAVSLFCSFVGSFDQYPEQTTFKESKMPCTSIRFQISNIYGRGQVVFVLFSFSGIDKPKWKNLQGKLRYHSLKKELSKVDCTYTNIKELTHGIDQRVSASMNLLAKSLPSDVRDLQFRSESSYPDVDTTIFCLGDQNKFAQNHMDVAAAPSLLICHHLKLLTESNLTSNCFQESMSFTLEEDQQSISKRASSVVDRIAPAAEINSLNTNSPTGTPLDMGTVGCENNSRSASREHDITDSTVSLECSDIHRRFRDQNVPCVGGDKLCSSNIVVICSPQKPEEQCPSIDIPQDKPSDPPDDEMLSNDEKATQTVSSLVHELNEYPIGCGTPTAPRTTYHRNRFTSLSRTFGDGSKLWPEDIILTAFTGGSKKARSQVSHSVSPRGDELGLKHKGHIRNIQSHSSTKTIDVKRLPDNTRSGESSPESLTCVANVLVTAGDRGWREYDTHITIDTDGQSDRRICVRLADATKYSHKVSQVLQPGATNRYTHAMLWKGGPEWYLEFPDRSQWLIFKQMHAECYSHNIRAASVKNIPIPGVRLVEGHDDNDGVPFMRQEDYICHIGPDVEIALDDSRLMYDMDSEDEDWIPRCKKSLGDEDNTECDLTEDMFERVMDKFEKFAYTNNCNELTFDQLSELDMDNVPLDIIKVVHDYWHDKRQTKGMPLIRHFQSAMWKIYEQRIQEWESTVCKIQGSSNGYQEKNLPPKPALFAFCLKPRGLQLQVPSKGLKQRSHKKIMSSACHSFSREQDSFCRQVSSLKYNDYAVDGRTFESYDGGSLHSPTGYSPRFSTRTDSPRAFDSLDRGSAPRFFRANSAKRNANFAFSEDQQSYPPFRHQKIKRGAPDHWKTVINEYQNSKHLFPGIPPNHRVDINDLKVRDAANAAQHAVTMARLKRERANCLMLKADLALHKASVALMMADAIKGSSRDSSRVADSRRDSLDEEP